jgi:hypothetical protein
VRFNPIQPRHNQPADQPASHGQPPHFTHRPTGAEILPQRPFRLPTNPTTPHNNPGLRTHARGLSERFHAQPTARLAFPVSASVSASMAVSWLVGWLGDWLARTGSLANRTHCWPTLFRDQHQGAQNPGIQHSVGLCEQLDFPYSLTVTPKPALSTRPSRPRYLYLPLVLVSAGLFTRFFARTQC